MYRKMILMLLAISLGICFISSCGRLDSDSSVETTDSTTVQTDGATVQTENTVIQAESTETTVSVETIPSETDSNMDAYDLQARLEAGEIVEIDSGTSVFLDWDNKPDMISIEVDDEKDEYTLHVNDVDANGKMSVSSGISEEIVLVQLKSGIIYNKTAIIVTGYNEDDGPISTFYMYADEQLIQMGTIKSAYGPSEGWCIQKDGNIATLSILTYGPVCWTCFYNQTYIIAEGSEFADRTEYALARVPKDMYPIGMVVESRIPIPIYDSRYSDVSSWTVELGESIILSATDNTDYFYVESLDGSKDGWLKIEGSDILVDDTPMSICDIFYGVWSAG